MIINPETPAWCSPSNLGNCPPYHITPNDTKIFRNDTADFPYGAYHYYCVPGNAQHLEKPYSTCDPYSNPQAQELVQLLPHPIWAEYGYPTKQGDGWVGSRMTDWDLDAGGLSSRLYFYQVHSEVLSHLLSCGLVNDQILIHIFQSFSSTNKLQDPGSTPARRIWTSVDVGTEIFVSNQEEVAEWALSEFDVILS